jgi:hypothetical protein
MDTWTRGVRVRWSIRLFHEPYELSRGRTGAGLTATLTLWLTRDEGNGGMSKTFVEFVEQIQRRVLQVLDFANQRAQLVDAVVDHCYKAQSRPAKSDRAS